MCEGSELSLLSLHHPSPPAPTPTQATLRNWNVGLRSLGFELKSLVAEMEEAWLGGGS